jgi:hypothetical protein
MLRAQLVRPQVVRFPPSVPRRHRCRLVLFVTMAENGHPAKKAKTEQPNAVFSHHSICLVLDYGSQYTQLIARRIRENGVLSMLMPGDATMVGVCMLQAHPWQRL